MTARIGAILVTTRRHFGTVRKRPSGRWQALYWHEDRIYSAGTFAAKADALAYLASIETDIRRGGWVDPRSGKVTLKTYANEWLEHRPDLALRTKDLYRYVLDRHILPKLGSAPLADLAPSKIRSWHAGIAADHPATAAKAYRLLSSILRTAVVDGVILSSPCKVDGGGTERPAERPIATVAEIEALEVAMPEHLRVIVPLATWCQLRRGEILGLRRKDVDALHATIHIEQTRTFTMSGRQLVKQPKTASGYRSLAVPAHLMAKLVEHLDRFTDAGPDCLVFTGRRGTTLSRDALQGSWERARLTAGRPDLRFHDLRHTGLTLAAATGATTVELMHRAGHASAAAAMRYQHAIKERDRVLADALEDMVRPEDVTRIGKRRGNSI
jgi:integrase